MSDQAAERIVPTKPWVRVHHDGPDTEQEAGELAKAKYPKQALKVLRYLMRVGGDTDGKQCIVIQSRE